MNGRSLKKLKRTEGPPRLRGLDISEEEASTYRRNFMRFHETGEGDKNLVPVVGINLPPSCNYDCIYCVYGSSSSIKATQGLTESEMNRLLDEAKDIGAKTIEIAGKGEPTIWPGIRRLVSRANSLGLTTVIFTNGSMLARENGFAEFLYENGVSLLLKYNSFTTEVQNKLSGTSNAARYRDGAFEKMVKLGFNRETPTRFGIETIICVDNATEILELWNFARRNNIFPFFEEVHLMGNATGLSDKPFILDQKEMKNLFESVAKLDRTQWGYYWTPHLPYMGFPCTNSEHITVDETGEVASCFEYQKGEGNIKDRSLLEIIGSSDYLYRVRKIREEKGSEETCRDCSCETGKGTCSSMSTESVKNDQLRHLPVIN